MLTKSIPYFIAIFILVAVLIYYPDSDEGILPPSAMTSEIINHPLYRNYEYGSGDSIIDIGTQPLWVPTSIISELMRRDLILKDNLLKEGCTLRFHPYLKGVDVNYFLDRGDLETAIGGDMPVLKAAAKNHVLITSLIQQGLSSLVARKQMLIQELEDKRIGLAYGSNAHYALLKTLADAGVDEKRVKLVLMDVDVMVEELEAGHIDAFSAWEPNPTIAMAGDDRLVVIHKSLISGFLYFSRQFAERRPEIVRQIISSEIRALRWAALSPDNLLQACSWAIEAEHEFSGKEPILSPKQYVKMARNDLLSGSRMAEIPQHDLIDGGRLYQEFRFLKELGELPKDANWTEVRSCFNNDILAEIYSRAREYRLDTFNYMTSTSQEEHYEAQ